MIRWCKYLKFFIVENKHFLNATFDEDASALCPNVAVLIFSVMDWVNVALVTGFNSNNGLLSPSTVLFLATKQADIYSHKL